MTARSERDGGGGQGERRRHPVEHHCQGRPAERERDAEVAAGDVPDVAQVLHDQRLIEAIEPTEGRALLLTGLGREQDECRVPRQRHEQERDRGDAEQRRRSLEQPPDDVARHRSAADGPRTQRGASVK
jgi:hypothetical protein